jgi:periplasmic divalent cation tolerance protein
LKTSDAQNIIEKRVTELHPYDIPCILSLPVAAINAPYLSWLAQSLGE